MDCVVALTRRRTQLLIAYTVSGLEGPRELSRNYL